MSSLTYVLLFNQDIRVLEQTVTILNGEFESCTELEALLDEIVEEIEETFILTISGSTSTLAVTVSDEDSELH